MKKPSSEWITFLHQNVFHTQTRQANKKFEFEWPNGYKYEYHDISEFYYKESGTLSGRMGAIKETLKQGFEIFNEYLDRMKDK